MRCPGVTARFQKPVIDSKYADYMVDWAPMARLSQANRTLNHSPKIGLSCRLQPNYTVDKFEEIGSWSEHVGVMIRRRLWDKLYPLV